MVLRRTLKHPRAILRRGAGKMHGMTPSLLQTRMWAFAASLVVLVLATTSKAQYGSGTISLGNPNPVIVDATLGSGSVVLNVGAGTIVLAKYDPPTRVSSD